MSAACKLLAILPWSPINATDENEFVHTQPFQGYLSILLKKTFTVISGTYGRTSII